MTESIIVDGTKCTQIGDEDGDTGLNVFSRIFADRVEVFPSSGGVNPLEETISQTAHGFTVGQVLYPDGVTFSLAQANAAATSNAIGVVETVVDANTFIIKFMGQWQTAGLTGGSVYYLSDSVAGGLTTTPPSSPNYVVPIYTAYSATRAIINIQQAFEGA